MEDPNKCSKCGSEIVEGFLLDATYGTINHKVTTWIQGKPEKSLFQSIKTHGKTMLNVTTFKCSSCGFLESYAN